MHLDGATFPQTCSPHKKKQQQWWENLSSLFFLNLLVPHKLQDDEPSLSLNKAISLPFYQSVNIDTRKLFTPPSQHPCIIFYQRTKLNPIPSKSQERSNMSHVPLLSFIWWTRSWRNWRVWIVKKAVPPADLAHCFLMDYVALFNSLFWIYHQHRN